MRILKLDDVLLRYVKLFPIAEIIDDLFKIVHGLSLIGWIGPTFAHILIGSRNVLQFDNFWSVLVKFAPFDVIVDLRTIIIAILLDLIIRFQVVLVMVIPFEKLVLLEWRFDTFFCLRILEQIRFVLPQGRGLRIVLLEYLKLSIGDERANVLPFDV